MLDSPVYEYVAGIFTGMIFLFFMTFIFDLGERTQLALIVEECNQRGSFVSVEDDTVYFCEQQLKGLVE